MQIAKFVAENGKIRIGSVEEDSLVAIESHSVENPLFELLESEDPIDQVQSTLNSSQRVRIDEVQLLPPLDRHEVWAAGVTYLRSQSARMEESEAAADCYERVYRSEQPELFPKAAPHRVVGPGEPLRLRADSNWMVPEPEVALVLNSRLDIVGYTIGNDLSCRDIEGDNPLYLPQAKIFEGACSLGPWITLASKIQQPNELAVEMTILRDGQPVFQDETSTSQMARTFPDLVSWLGRELTFAEGAVLLTGTGIVPNSSFSLQSRDTVDITVQQIGTLRNPIA